MLYPCQLIVEFLIALDGFHQLTIFLFQVCSGGSMFHPLPHTDAKILFPRLNSSKQRSKSSTRYCFWSDVSKRGTNFENNLRITKDSCKIINILPSDIFKMSAISRNFDLRSPKTIMWTFVMFSGTTAGFGRPEHLGVIGVLKMTKVTSPKPL